MNSKGFTLVEVLVALTLLTVALVPAFIQATNAMSLRREKAMLMITDRRMAAQGVLVAG